MTEWRRFETFIASDGMPAIRLAEPDPDTVVIAISRDDVEEMATFLPEPSKRFMLGRLTLACREALEVDGD